MRIFPWLAVCLMAAMLTFAGGCKKQAGSAELPITEWRLVPVLESGIELADLGLSDDCIGRVYQSIPGQTVYLRLLDEIPAGFKGDLECFVDSKPAFNASALLKDKRLKLPDMLTGDHRVIVEAKIDEEVVAMAIVIIRVK